MKDLVIFRQMLHHLNNTSGPARLMQFAAESYRIGNTIEQVCTEAYVCVSDCGVHVCESSQRLLAWVAKNPKSTVYKIVGGKDKEWSCIYTD